MINAVKYTLISVGVVVVGSLIAWYALRPEEEPPRTVTAEYATVTQDVAFTGRLQSDQVSHLSFEAVGTVQEVLVELGDAVQTGQALAHLDTTGAGLELAIASANLSSSQEKTKLAWDAAKQDLTNLTSLNAKALEKKRQAVRDAKAELDHDRLVHQQTALENGNEASATQTAIATLKLAESTYHAAQQAVTETIQSQQKAEVAARATADAAEAAYIATVQASGSSSGLSSLEATEAIAQNKLTKQTIRAPFAGIVTAVNKTKGETATTGETVITVETTDVLELVADVTETDAAKLQLDMSATITFDALPAQEQWQATVATIAPAARIIEGVPTYEVSLQVTEVDQRFRPGLTTNITVHANSKPNVVAIPRRAVATRGEKQHVRLLTSDGSITEQEVTTGLAGSDGSIEIISGVQDGDNVIVDTSQPR